MSVTKKKPTSTLAKLLTPFNALVIVSSLYLFTLVIFFILTALANGLNMDTYAADGTFQLYNPLRRIAEGQIIMKDFPFFHGVAVPYLHHPVFAVFGSNVFAAEVAKWIVSPLIFLIVSLAFFMAFFKNVRKAIVATSLLTVLSFISIDVIWPGNSLLGIRSAFPVIVAAFLLWKPSLKLKLKTRSIDLFQPVVFVLLALCFTLGTEQGLAAILAYLLVSFVSYIRSDAPFKDWWWKFALYPVGIAVALFVTLSIFTLGHAYEALHYALVDIPKDQGWYFGAPPNDFIAWNTLWYIVDEKMVRYILPVIGLGALAFVSSWKLKLFNPKQLFIFWFLIVYGLIVFAASATGYWAPTAQLVPLTRVMGLVAIAGILALAFKYMKNKNKYARYVSVAAIILGVMLIGWNSYKIVRQILDYPIKYTLSETRIARKSPDGTYVSAYWHKRIDSFTPYIDQDAKIWSTYTGLYDSMRSQLNQSPGGEDYIIHALGPERRDQYTKEFINLKPDYVITLKSTYFWYEEWLWSRHWDFYSHLYNDYTVITDNDSHILWKRNSTSSPNTSQLNDFTAQNDKYTANVGVSTKPRLFEVTLDYRLLNKNPLNEKLSRNLITISGSSVQRFAISLPPYENRWTFPVMLSPNDSDFNLSANSYGLLATNKIDIKSATYKEIPLSKNNEYPLYDSYCSFGGTNYYPELGTQFHSLRCKKDELNLKNYLSNSSFKNLK